MNKNRNDLKSLFTSYWEYLAIQTACKLSVFDFIIAGINTLSKLQSEIKGDENALNTLLIAITNNGYLIKNDDVFSLTEKSIYLTDDHPESLKNACILWGIEHMDAWQNLENTIKTGKPEFSNYFEYLSDKPSKLENYHKAMNEYSIEDYENICNIIDFAGFKSIMDVGGGLGGLIKQIGMQFSEKDLLLFEKPEVVDLVPSTSVELIKGDFFNIIPSIADCIILSRVIHDWEDSKANKILANCYSALPEKGQLILIENFSNEIKNNASLLSLNMMIMCESHERTKDEYLNLLSDAGFNIKEIKKLNELQYIIISEK